jgi:sterol desaturase/sphingolipid hydroxylase (fatty acid hydroxylase superfamily)
METLDIKVAVLGSVIVTMMVLERLFPKARPLAAAGLRTLADKTWRVLKNASLLLISAGLSPLVVIPLSALASTHALGWRPDWWSGWQGLVIDLLILDFWIYWWHRANHEIPFLWRFHEVHHLDEFLDASSAFRFHFGEVMLSAVVRAVVIWLMDIPLASVVIFETMVLSMALFHHSNVNLPDWLERPFPRSSSRRRSTGCITMRSGQIRIRTMPTRCRSGTSCSVHGPRPSAGTRCRLACRPCMTRACWAC